jgi:hypothetical protein
MLNGGLMTETKISIKTVIYSAIGVIIGSIIATQFISSSKVSFDKELMEISNKTNKTCPFMVDKKTRLDETIGGPGKKFSYIYTLVNYAEKDIAKDRIDNFVGKMKLQLINNVRTDKDMKEFRDMSVEMVYIYKSKDGHELARITISPHDY